MPHTMWCKVVGEYSSPCLFHTSRTNLSIEYDIYCLIDDASWSSSNTFDLDNCNFYLYSNLSINGGTIVCPVLFWGYCNAPCFDYLLVAFWWGVSDCRLEHIAANLLVELCVVSKAVVTVSTVRGHCCESFK